VIIIFVSLAAFAGGLGLLFYHLNRGKTEVKEISQTSIQSEPLEHPDTSSRGIVRWGVVAAVVTVGFALLDRLVGNPITAEFETLSFFISVAGVFTFSFIVLNYLIRYVAGQTQWLWLVRAAIILGAIGLISNVVPFVVIWFGLAPMPLTNVVVLNLIILGLLLALRMIVAALFTIIAGILIPLFYFVLIGLVVAFPPPILFGISAGNALLVAALILRPKFLVHWLGYGASWTAKQLRRLPSALQ
jgi:hypothetical protein